MKSSRASYFIAAITSVALWGFFSIPLRSLQNYPSQEILYYRIFSSLIIVWLVILIFRKKQIIADVDHYQTLPKKEKKNLVLLTLLAGVLITGNWYTFIYAVNHVSITSAAFAYMVCPLITAFGGFILLKEPLSKIKLIALGIAVISIISLMRGSYIEVLWSIFIASLYAFYLIIQKVVQHFDRFNLLGVQLIISTILMLPLYLSFDHQFPDTAHFWINILIIAVFFTIIPLFLSLYALIGMPSSTLGVIIYINPLVAFCVAIFYFHEGISNTQAIAYSLLLFAVVVFNWKLIKELSVKKFKRKETSEFSQ